MWPQERERTTTGGGAHTTNTSKIEQWHTVGSSQTYPDDAYLGFHQPVRLNRAETVISENPGLS